MLYNDEVELKKKLDSKGIRYGRGETKKFVLCFYDNKSGADLLYSVYSSPVEGIRDLGNVLKSTKLPVEDISIELNVVFDSRNLESWTFEDIELSPYLYFKKQAVTTDTASTEENK